MNGLRQLPRGAGLLLHISSLPSPYGIGNLGQKAYEFADFLAEAGQRYWQVLPLGPTGFGDSPYQSFSVFAGNPYFIDLDDLIGEGLLTEEEVQKPAWGKKQEAVDYGALYEERFPLLRRAFARWNGGGAEFAAFAREAEAWLPDYAAFMVQKEAGDDPAFWAFLQFFFFRQWRRLKSYVNKKGIALIGDMPIYAAMDSADVWGNPRLFQLDERGKPLAVAGVPPDDFCADGQVWGNPLYAWDRMAEEDFAWWRKRMAWSAKLYDVVRIDHFIGIARYFSIPADTLCAARGSWLPGPGEALLAALNEAAGETGIIAENLGVLAPEVRSLLEQSGYPGMKVLSFAFCGGPQNEHLPIHFSKNTVAYAGTHDNDTLWGMFSGRSEAENRFAMDYLDVSSREELPAAAIRALYAGVADVAMVSAQDLLGLGREARMNFPATTQGNWQWRLREHQLTGEHGQWLKKLAVLYDR